MREFFFLYFLPKNGRLKNTFTKYSFINYLIFSMNTCQAAKMISRSWKEAGDQILFPEAAVKAGNEEKDGMLFFLRPLVPEHNDAKRKSGREVPVHEEPLWLFVWISKETVRIQSGCPAQRLSCNLRLSANYMTAKVMARNDHKKGLNPKWSPGPVLHEPPCGHCMPAEMIRIHNLRALRPFELAVLDFIHPARRWSRDCRWRCWFWRATSGQMPKILTDTFMQAAFWPAVFVPDDADRPCERSIV